MKDKTSDQGIIKEKCSGPSTRFPEMGGVTDSLLRSGVEKSDISRMPPEKHPLKK
jgi:hypothetical protein